MAHAVRHPLPVAEVIGWPKVMRLERISQPLAPVAGLLFALGGLAGWGSVTVMRGCVAVDPEASSAHGHAGPSSPTGTPTVGDEEPGGAPAESGVHVEEEAESSDGAAPALPSVPEGVPRGRAIADLDPEVCFELLEDAGVAHDRDVDAVAEEVDQVAAPLRLQEPVAEITYAHVGRSAKHEVMDCRLALTLLRWGPALRAAGVHRVEHMSVFRPEARVNGTGKPSAHATALAIDAARFHFDDGTELDVLEHWADKTRGAAPCDEREDEPDAQARLRSLVCDAIEADLFQVVITPHHNRAHHNHVHLELAPDVDWSFVR